MSLELVIGPMFSGKSSHIYSTAKRFRSIGMNVLVVKPTIDNRYSTNPEVTTHDGVTTPCILKQDLMSVPLQFVDVIIIEEAQFFNDLLKFVKHAVDTHHKHVVVVGLDGDSERRPFGQILDCIPLADKIMKLTSMCSNCKDGTPALFTHRKVSEHEQVCVGGADMYSALCRWCYLAEN